MQESIHQSGLQREAFRFPLLARGAAQGIRFLVFACLPSGKCVLIGVAATRQNAAALTRLVAPRSGLGTLIIEEIRVPSAPARSKSARARADLRLKWDFARLHGRRTVRMKNRSRCLQGLFRLGV